MDLGVAMVLVQLVQALAWPVAVVVVLLVLRRPITEAIGRVHHLEHGATRVSFGEGVRAVQEELPAEVARRKIDAPLRSRLVELAASQPKLAVLEAWDVLEERLRQLARGANLELPEDRGRAPNELAERLRKAGLVSNATCQALVEMRLLRNKVKHWSRMRVRSDEALAYIDSALKLAAETRAPSDPPRA